MALPVTQLDPLFYFSSDVKQTPAGARLVWLSTRPNGNAEDKPVMMLAGSEVDPTNEAHIATLPSAPFGWNPIDVNASTQKLTLELTPDIVPYFEQIDTFCKEQAVIHAEEWFKKPMSAAEAERGYKPLVKPVAPDKADKYNPLLGVKVNMSGDRATKILVARDQGSDSDKCSYYEGTVHDIRAKSKCLVVCEASQLWIVRGEWGITLTATEVTVFPPPSRKRGIEAFGELFHSKMQREERGGMVDEPEQADGPDEPVV